MAEEMEDSIKLGEEGNIFALSLQPWLGSRVGLIFKKLLESDDVLLEKRAHPNPNPTSILKTTRLPLDKRNTWT